MRRILLASACFAVVVTGPMALAQTVDIVIEIDAVVFESGVLATESVPEELQGQTCDVTAIAENNSSVRPGSNLIVSSGGDSVTLLDVEREEGAVTTANEPLTLGPEVTVSVEVGPEGAFSGGITVQISCQPAPSPSPSETPSPSPSETPSPTESPSPTETETPSVSPTEVTSPPPTESPPPDETATVEPTAIAAETPPRGLAFTGPGGWQLWALASAALLVVGLGLLRAGHKRRRAV